MTRSSSFFIPFGLIVPCNFSKYCRQWLGLLCDAAECVLSTPSINHNANFKHGCLQQLVIAQYFDGLLSLYLKGKKCGQKSYSNSWVYKK